MTTYTFLGTENHRRAGSLGAAFIDWLMANPASTKEAMKGAGHDLKHLRWDLKNNPTLFKDEGEITQTEVAPKKEVRGDDLPVLTEGSKKLFLELADDAPNWSGKPLFGANVGGDKSSLGHLTDLKKKGLLTTSQDEDNPKCFWVSFTDLGIAYGTAYGVEWTDEENKR